MNLIEGLKQHKKTFQKFVEWMIDKRAIPVKNVEQFCNGSWLSNRELLSLLLEFCDEQGYYLTIQKDYTVLGEVIEVEDWDYYIVGKNFYRESFDFETRIEATQEGAKKVFELMEMQ